MNVIDLFCGAGGLSYGFQRAGFDVLLGIDSDQKALPIRPSENGGSFNLIFVISVSIKHIPTHHRIYHNSHTMHNPRI